MRLIFLVFLLAGCAATPELNDMGMKWGYPAAVDYGCQNRG